MRRKNFTNDLLLDKKKKINERVGNMVVLYLDSSSSKATTKRTSPETKLRV